jgi:GMP synthase (glutamine-hydrolysing)
MEMFTQHLHLPVTMVDQSEAMLAKLKGVTDPEKKRKLIGAEFIQVCVTCYSCVCVCV